MTICDKCVILLLSRASGERCLKCSKKINISGIIKKVNCCDLCDKLHFDKAMSFCTYEGLARKIVLAIKNDNTLHAKTIAMLLYGKFKSTLTDEETVITIVPSSQKTTRSRMYNQLSLIANHLKKIDKNLTIKNTLLKKTRETPKQSSLSQKARSKNLKNAFNVHDIQCVQKFNKFIIIDDVMTTGSTFSEVAKTIKAKNPLAEVICISFCSTEF